MLNYYKYFLYYMTTFNVEYYYGSTISIANNKKAIQNEYILLFKE